MLHSLPFTVVSLVKMRKKHINKIQKTTIVYRLFVLYNVMAYGMKEEACQLSTLLDV